ncbi:MAG: HypC/HybG/HupF family hydrogenase formation chaperone [Pyramidobacter sp.]|nr:HypC/HybG/HupF family hydrogenase formation chaperone [Pyramidobacter sp.]
MCLAVPHKIEALNGDGTAEASAGPVRRTIHVDFLDSPAVGDLVLVHAGFAIEKVKEEDSAELERLWDAIRENAGHDGTLPF